MTDYEIQKATASKVGVVSSPENIVECRKAILEKLGGDSTDADTIYECDKRILPLIGGGSANLQAGYAYIGENSLNTFSPDSGFDGFSDFTVDVYVPETPVQEKSITITENGTTSVVPDEVLNLSKVDITVNVHASNMPIVTMTAAEYAAITPDSSTIYLIKD